MLPKTLNEISNGGLYRQAVRCGKPRCRCATGQLHPGYWYFFTRIAGKLHKYYVAKGEVEGFAVALAEAKNERVIYRQSLRDAKRRLTDMRQRLREIATS